MALIPRAVIGKYNNGTYGLKVSLPGINALTDDDSDGSKFSFNSEWNDFVKIHAIGIASYSGLSVHPFRGTRQIFFADLGYRPFCEIRRVSGNVVYDDYLIPGTSTSGIGDWIETNQFGAYLNSSVTTALYVVYKIPIPVP